MKLFYLICLVFGASCALKIKSTSFHKIIKHVNSLETSWTAGKNFEKRGEDFSIKNLFGLMESDIKLPIKEEQNITDLEIPEEFDAREHWPNCPSIRHIRDQGNCASCWAVAGASTLTDRVCIASNGTFTLQLSNNQVTACAFPYGGLGCEGGTERAAWDFFADKGLVTGGDYNSNIGCQPYEITPCDHHLDGELPNCDKYPTLDTPKCQKKCINPSYSNAFEDDNHKIISAYMLPFDVKSIQKEIIAHGPLVTGFDAYEDFLTYKSGVYQYVTGKKVGRHGVRVIGWGTEKGTPYWLITNSWNTHWGDKGVFKFIRGVNNCGIDQSFVGGIPIIEAIKSKSKIFKL